MTLRAILIQGKTHIKRKNWEGGVVVEGSWFWSGTFGFERFMPTVEDITATDWMEWI